MVREHFVTCGQMKLLEKRADENGLSYYQMMENAGEGAANIILDISAYLDTLKETEEDGEGVIDFKVAEKIISSLPEEKKNLLEKHLASKIEDAEDLKNHKTTYILCGKGNNGGDGLVVARHLCNAGHIVTVMLADGKPVTEAASKNLEILKEMPVRIVDLKENARAIMDIREKPDIIVDAVYGTGFRGKLKSAGLKAAIYINKCGQFGGASKAVVFSLDVPSGMGGDVTSEKTFDSNCVKADYTITFHAKKPVHLQRFAQPYCGEIRIVDIGIDEEALWNVKI